MLTARNCRRLLTLAAVATASSGCAPRWDSMLQANTQQVARALGDPADIGQPLDPKTVPQIDPPKALRPCCAFGVDLKAKLGPVPVPGYEIGNIFGPKDIGPHGFDKGDLTRERNGLLYTCRGGFIDLAHVRDNVDRTTYLAMKIVKALPGELALELWEEGTLRRVRIKALPEGLMDRQGRWATATVIANYVNYELSVWHEVITWYGWESVPGIAERLSAFSPEDLYSNALGGNLAVGIIVNREIRSREQYDESVQAWISEGLRRLGAVDKEQARAAMRAVDGLWWDSKQRVPDMKLVTRRNLEIEEPLAGWSVGETLGTAAPPEIARMCQGQPAPLKMQVPTKIGDVALAELVTVEFEFNQWVPKKFPLPAKKGDKVTQADFKAIVEDVRRAGTEEMGAGFDRPDVDRPAVDKAAADEPDAGDAAEPAN